MTIINGYFKFTYSFLKISYKISNCIIFFCLSFAACSVSLHETNISLR